jgi:stage III sporulation protein AG
MEHVNEETQEKKQTLIVKFMKLDFKKKLQYLAVLLIVIVILAIYFASTSIPQNNETPNVGAAAVTEAGSSSIEEKLQETLSKIEGAGQVQVMITYESSAEIVPAISVDTQTSTTTDESENGNSTTNTENKQSEIVTVNGSDGNGALVLKENSPPVKGVIVVAQGADDIGVKLSLLGAVETILNISPDQVDVYKMQNE